MAPALNFEKESSSPPSMYYISFDNYLKPKRIKKHTPLLFPKQGQRKPQLRLQLLEHPVLKDDRKSKWFLFKAKLCKVLKSKIKEYTPKTFQNLTIGNIRLPRILTFLHARNDHTACKRKSGFEIYCELASIHGFNNFVDATTWQRAFWFLVILCAVIMSGSIVLLSHFMNAETPTILYSESTQYPTSSIPFPAVTICNLNKISKSNAENVAKKFQKTTNITLKALTSSFLLTLATTENIKAIPDYYKTLKEVLKINYTMLQLLDEIAPNCKNQLLRCKFKGRFVRCSDIFKVTQTSYGLCCSFNYKALNTAPNDHIEYITNSGYINGLTVLLDPLLEDYMASSFLTPGFQVFIHGAYEYVNIGTTQTIITPITSNKISVSPHQTYATDLISSLDINTRKCYLPNERKLYHFHSYSQANCLAECLSSMTFKKCNCTLPYRPKMNNWTVCGLEYIPCYVKYKYSLLSNVGQFTSDCYPLCNYNMYKINTDSAVLTRKYSITEKRLYKGINITNHILLRVFIGEMHAERLRLDVSENWLSFIGTFGGITGLYMGYSFLSGFELIFFVFVRPACNWWSKKQIQYRIKKRQKKEQQEQKHNEK